MIQDYINGLPVEITEYALEKYQYRFPRSKKRRIRKKWAKRDINYKSRPGAYIIEKPFGFLGPELKVLKQKVLICHPLVFEVLKKKIDKRNRNGP